MIDFYRKFFFPAVIFCLLAMIFFALPSAAWAKQSNSKDKYAALVVDAETGAVLHQENGNKSLHPASLTKMMTLLMLFDAMERGQVSESDRITISQHAASMPPSKFGLKPGQTIKVEDAIYALVTKSANDIAVAVAEHLGKTESNFARLMTRKAKSLGMSNTVFRNASGLHNPAQVTTARDMGRLGLILIKHYGDYYHYFSKRSFTYRGKTHQNHNRLMSAYDGMDGMKTGYIAASGFNLVASAKRDGRRLVGVVFGGKTASSRNERMRDILDQGFARIGKGRMNVASSNDGLKVPSNAPTPARKPVAQTDIAQAMRPDTSLQDSASRKRMLQEQALMQTKGEDMRQSYLPSSRWAILEDSQSGAMLRRMNGEGDFDDNQRNRVKTGLIAVSAHSGEPIPPEVWRADSLVSQNEEEADVSSSAPVRQAVSYNPQESSGDADWAIQVGAFTSRDSTDRAIAASLKQLPQHLRSASAIIAPVQTPQGWIFRARLNGYTQSGAEQACSILKECIPIAPHQ